MDIKISEEQLDCLNELYAKISGITSTVKSVKDAMSEKFGLTDKEGKRWRNPIDTFDIEMYVAAVRENMIHFAVDEICPKPNFKIGKSKAVKYIDEKLGRNSFDAKEIRDYIKKEYIDKADELSLEEIKREVTRLLPVVRSDKGRRNTEVKDILTGKKGKEKMPQMLKLEAYVGWDSYCIDMESFYKRIIALEKLVDITLAGTAPSDARGDIIRTIYWDAKYSSEGEERERRLLERHYTQSSAWIEWVKLYKNSRFDVEFRKAEDAARIATVLIEAQSLLIY